VKKEKVRTILPRTLFDRKKTEKQERKQRICFVTLLLLVVCALCVNAWERADDEEEGR
jgi:hypothetical protein